MKKLNAVIIAVCFATVLLCSSSVFTQQPTITSEKKALIQEVLELTGMQEITTKQEVNSSNIGSSLVKFTEKETDLSDVQRAELKRLSLEAAERIERDVRQFSEDKSVIGPLFKESCFQVYDRTFSESELREMVVFYRTPTGQKAAKFTMKIFDQVSKSFVEAFKQKFKEFASFRLQQERELLKQKIQEMKQPKLES